MKNILKKLLAATAVVSVFGAAAAFMMRRFQKKQEQKNLEQNTEDLDTLDFDSIHNDTPREYVSIRINERNPEPAQNTADKN